MTLVTKNRIGRPLNSNPSRQYAKRVFISYTMSDYSAAQALKVRLEASGSRVSLVPGGVKDPQKFVTKAREEIKNCDIFVSIRSRASATDCVVMTECKYARKHALRIIPVDIDNAAKNFNMWAECAASKIMTRAMSEAERDNGDTSQLGSSFWTILVLVALIIYVMIGYLKDSASFFQAHLALLPIDMLDGDPSTLLIIGFAALIGLALLLNVFNRIISFFHFPATDLAVVFALTAGTALFVFAFMFIPLMLAGVFTLIYILLRQNLKRYPRIVILPMIAVWMVGVFWAEEFLYDSLRTDAAVVLLLPSSNCSYGNCAAVTYDFYKEIYREMDVTLDDWEKLVFLPLKMPTVEQYEKKFLRAYQTDRNSANLVRDILLNDHKTFDRALILSLAVQNNVCGSKTVIIDPKLRNWQSGQSPFLAFGKFRWPSHSKPESVEISEKAVPLAALFFSIDLVDRIKHFEVDWVDEDDIRRASIRLITVTNRLIDNIDASVGDEDPYRVLLSQAAQLDDTSLQLGALKVVTRELIARRNLETNPNTEECLTRQVRDIVGQAISVEDRQ